MTASTTGDELHSSELRRLGSGHCCQTTRLVRCLLRAFFPWLVPCRRVTNPLPNLSKPFETMLCQVSGRIQLRLNSHTILIRATLLESSILRLVFFLNALYFATSVLVGFKSMRLLIDIWQRVMSEYRGQQPSRSRLNLLHGRISVNTTHVAAKGQVIYFWELSEQKK